jgi:hypothetical protein
MGWALVLVRNVIFWLDSLAQKSIMQAVPNLENLLCEPRETLTGREILIGPARRYATGIFWGLVTALAGWFLAVLVLLLAFNPQRAAPGRQGPVGILLLILLFAVLPGAVVFAFQFVRGGQMALKGRGVELRFRGKVVFCPWALFNTPGQPFSPAADRVVLPVAPQAVPLVEARYHGTLLAAGLRVNTQQWRFRSAQEAVLKALYEVSAEELVKVLLFLGRILGGPFPREAPALDFPQTELAEAVPFREGPGGWVTVSLTRLVFPACCCACGAPTRGRQKATAAEPFFTLGRMLHPTRRESISLWVPVCYPCQTSYHRKFQQAVLNGLGTGVLVVLLAGITMCLWPIHIALVLFFIFSLPLAPLVGCLIGYRIGKRRAHLVQLRGYSSRKGTVAIRFRRAEYTDQMLAAMRTKVEV